MVTRITNDGSRAMEMKLSLELHPAMEGKSRDNQVRVDSEHMEVVMSGRAPYDFEATKWDDNRGIEIESRSKVLLPGKGSVSVEGNSLRVAGADEIIVLFTSETSFKDAVTDPANSGVDYSNKVRRTLDSASKKTYGELKNRHLEEYRALFRRFWLDMSGSDVRTANGTMVSPYEYARNYQYGRYINICCERENSIMPQELLGLWCASWSGPNQGAYFLNESMEKMQLLKGAANLSDSSESQYRYISSWAGEETGQKTAQQTYGAEEGAWMMSHSTGIWAKSGMWGQRVEYGSWLAGGIWALDSLFDKYEYTQDIELLKKCYPLLEGASKFALSTLGEIDGVNGELQGYQVVLPSGSPEHWYWVGGREVGFDAASVCDTLLYYNLFNMLEQGARDLERAGIAYDEVFLERVLRARRRMMPLEMFIDEETGRLKEWYNEYPVGDASHRHASHLLGLFLGHININESDTPEFFAAQKAEAKRWMEANGGTHPDRSLMVMRAGFEEFAFEHMSHGIVGTGYQHDDVMQWTALAGSIGEAIVDSRFGQINLMEHLPAAWKNGTVKGIRARGGYQLSIVWKDGELESCVIDSPTGETPRVLYKGNPVTLSADSRFTVNRADASLEDLACEAEEKLGGKYTKESKTVLKQATETGNSKIILAALLSMEPVKTIDREVNVESEDGIYVLTKQGETLTLKASSGKVNAGYRWEIKSADGKSASKIASVDADGTVTAIGGGRVVVTAVLEGEPNEKSSVELFVELPVVEEETIDDRDSRIAYQGNWLTWDEDKHENGTITYCESEHSQATLEFEGTGIEYVGSSARHIADFTVLIDKKTVASRIEAGDEGYARIMYSNYELDEGRHTITVKPLGSRIDVDAFHVYRPVPAATDRKAAIAEYRRALALYRNGEYAQAAKDAFLKALEQAAGVINQFDEKQEALDEVQAQIQTAVKAAQNGRVDSPEKPGETEKPGGKPSDTDKPDGEPGETKQPVEKPGGSKVPKKGSVYKDKMLTYKVTKSAAKGGTVTVTGLKKKSGKSAVIPSTVKMKGYTFKVTAVASKAFMKSKNLKSVVVGANVEKMGSKSFYKCKKLKSVTFKGKKAPKIGKQAFKGIQKTCRVYVPKKMAKKQLRLIASRMKKAGAGNYAVYQKR